MIDRPTIDGYLRISRVGGREGSSFISPDVQRAEVERWAEYAGVQVAAWHTDLDESGGTQDRPGLREAMRRIETGETGGIACARLDRFARNIAGAHGDLETIKRTGARLVCVAENIDTGASSAVGDFTFTVLLAVATMQRESMAEGWQSAVASAVERGAWIGAAPLGYERTGKAKPLRAHPKFGPIVTRAYELAASSGPHAALEYLRGQHVPVSTRKGAQAGERIWSLSELRGLLGSRVYLGESRNGEHVQVSAHPPLVSRAVWTAAQVPEHTGLRRRAAPGEYPLSGLAVCGTCGANMIGNGRGVKTRDGVVPRTYRCRASLSAYRGERCARPALVNADALEAVVREALADVVASFEVTISSPSEDVAALEAQLANAEHELSEFAADSTLRKGLGDGFAAVRDGYIATVETAREAYADAARSTVSAKFSAADLDADADLSGLARAVLASIVVEPGRGHVVERTRLVVIG